MAHDFSELTAVIERMHPGLFRFRPSNLGQAHGLRIERPGVSGFAFVFEPLRTDVYLLDLLDFGESTDGETFGCKSIEEVERCLRRWAFPREWTAPAPLDAVSERERLRRIRDGIAARTEVLVRLADGASRAAPDDVARIDARRLVASFPWDAAGRLALGEIVVLATYGDTPSQKKRTTCLVAAGPARRRDPQEIVVELRDEFVANQDHLWTRSPWLWTDAPEPSTEIDPPPAGEETLRDLDEGRIEEALVRHDVTLAPALHRLLGGERIVPPACCAHADQAWTDQLVSTVRASAPWNLVPALVEELERRGRARASRRRANAAPAVKLVVFPGQHHQRKASLMLATAGDGKAELVFEATATNARLHRRAWQRPLAMDLRRYGLG